MGFLGNLFNKNNTQQEKRGLEEEVSATSVIFGTYTLDGSATSLSAFFAALELISNSVAQLPIQIKREREIDTNHPLNLVFKSTLIGKFNFIKKLITDVILQGNAYAYIQRADDGTPINLIYQEYGDVQIHYNKYAQDLYYTSNTIKGKINPEDMIHLYKNALNDGVRGRSLISYANTVLELAKATDKTASKYYSSGCALQGVLTIKGARRGSKEQARNAFAETHSGSSGSGLVILDDDMTYQPISSNANESQMLEARVFNVQEIARYFNMNPLLLGDQAGASYKSIEAANIEFITRTLTPYISLIEGEFNRKLVKPGENIVIDLDETVLIRGDHQSQAEYLQKLVSSGIMTTNEARQTLGLPPKEGCDDLIVAYTKIDDNKIGKKDEKPDGNGDKDVDDPDKKSE